MGMFFKGAIASLNKQAEEALKPKEEESVCVMAKPNYSAYEAKAAMREFLNPEKIARMARKFITEKINHQIEERAKEGYDYAIISIKEYPSTPINEAVFKQVIVLLEQQGFSAKICSGASLYTYIREFLISWKEEE